MMRRSLVHLVLLIAFSSTGCGGGSPEEMPSVVGRRLDVAISDLGHRGVEENDVEIVGGGALGVVDKSNWTVCNQDPDAGADAEDVRLIVDRTCPGEDATEERVPPAESTTLSPTPSTAPPAPLAASPTAAPAPSASKTGAVPNVVGMDLQLAQDTMQASGFYNLSSHDETGQNRNQVVDRNWRVCSQRPAAGATVPLDSVVDLGVVRLDVEQCP